MASNEQADSKPSPSAKSRTSPGESSQSTGPLFPATPTCENLPQSSLLPMGSLPMLSVAASHAKTYLSPAEELALRRSEAGYGERSPDWLAKFDHPTLSWRTSQTCLLALASGEADGLAEFSETWPRSGMMRSGIAYRLLTLAPGIGGTEFGFLPTPTKSADSKGSPRGRFWGSGTCYSNLREILRDGPDDPIFPNPEFVEEMMGFPMFHTALPPSATPSSPKSPNSSGERSSRRSKPKV